MHQPIVFGRNVGHRNTVWVYFHFYSARIMTVFGNCVSNGNEGKGSCSISSYRGKFSEQLLKTWSENSNEDLTDIAGRIGRRFSRIMFGLSWIFCPTITADVLCGDREDGEYDVIGRRAIWYSLRREMTKVWNNECITKKQYFCFLR